MKRFLLLFTLLCVPLRAQIPVTDLANLANNELMQIENIAKWVESIEQLKTQIEQFDKQISIQGDLRNWAGNPTEASAKIGLDLVGAKDLLRAYGRAREEIEALVGSLDSLTSTMRGTYRAITDLDLDGHAVKFDEKTFRRYAVLDAKQANAADAIDQTADRIQDLQTEIAATLDALKSAPTDAEAHKQSAKLSSLSGQLAEIESARKRQVDEVVLQKISNDARIEEERLAAAQLEEQDAAISNERINDYMATIHLRKAAP